MTWEDVEHSNRLSPNARLTILRDESTWAKSDSPPPSSYFSPPRVEGILNEVIFVKETTSSVIWLWNCPPQAHVFKCGPQLVALFCSKVLGPLGGGASWLTQSSGADPEDCQQHHCWSQALCSWLSDSPDPPSHGRLGLRQISLSFFMLLLLHVLPQQ